MKTYTIVELEKLDLTQRKDILKERSDILIKLVAKTLQNQKIRSFGECSKVRKDKGELLFSITNINYKNEIKIYTTETSIIVPIDIYLDNYNSKSKRKEGSLYHDFATESSLNQLINELIDKKARVLWGEKKDQGDNFINVHFFFPKNLIMPDLSVYEECESNKKLKEGLEIKLVQDLKDFKNARFNITQNDNMYAPTDRKDLMEVIHKATQIFDKDTLKAIVKKNYDDKEIVGACLERCNDDLFEFASDRLKNDINFVLNLAFEKDMYNILEFAGDDIKNDDEIMLKAIKMNGYMIRAASDRLKQNKEVCLMAITNNIYAYGSISKELQSDKDIIMKAMETKGEFFIYSPEIKTNKKMLIQAFSTASTYGSNSLLEKTSEEFRNDRQVALAALICNKNNYDYLGKKLKNEMNEVHENDYIGYLQKIELNEKLNNEIEEIQKPIKPKIKI